METEIGPTLREARIRRKIDLTEIEERTKIRVRYLRALENEEWDLLPGPAYTRSFIRTYASFLGLDGDRLADDFRRFQERQVAEPAAGREPPVLPTRLPRAGGGRRLGAGFVGGVAATAVVIALLVLGLVVGDGDDEPDRPGAQVTNSRPNQGSGQGAAEGRPRPGVSIRLTATAEVWVCAVAADGTPVVDGQILTAGDQEGPFRSGRFELAFGNGGVDLQVDGDAFEVQDTPSPIGYQVTPERVRVLAEGTRPDCT
ncbi:MAG: RodZ domain-containing protein [Solirubrobacterales bacterium]